MSTYKKRLTSILAIVLLTTVEGLCSIPSAYGNVRLAFDSTSLDFGAVAVLGTKDLTIEVWDTSAVDVEIDQIAPSGIDASDFSVLSPTTPLVVNAGIPIHTKIIVQFNPQALGSRSASLLIETTDGNVTVPLAGTGAGKKSSLAWSADTIDFGTITPGAEHDSIIELYSTGTDTALITGIGLAAADTSFATNITSGSLPPLRLAPGDSVAVSVAFRGLPLLGMKAAQLSGIESNGNIPSCNMTGDVELGSFDLQPASPIDFGTMYEGQVRDTTVYLINTSSLDLVVEDLSLSPSGDDFLLLHPMTLPFTLGAGDTLAIPLRANPGLTTSHVAQLLVVSQSADPHFGSARLEVAVTPTTLSSVSSQDLTNYCASGPTIYDTLPVTNPGPNVIIITGLTFKDTNIRITANVSFPDTLSIGTSQNLILRLDPPTPKDTLALLFVGGDKVIFTDTIRIHPSVMNAATSLIATASSSLLQNMAVAATAPLGVFHLDSIIVHLFVQDANVATIDPSSIALTSYLTNASIVSILPEAGGEKVTIALPAGISISAGVPLLDFILYRYITAADSTDVSVTIETPERVGCIEWSADTTRIGAAEACGNSILQQTLLQSPLILSVSVRHDPVIGSTADLRIDAGREDDAHFELFNALGVKMSEGTLHLRFGANEYRLALSAIPSGSYTIRLLPANGTPVSLRLLKLN